jgi:uncharacterized protein
LTSLQIRLILLIDLPLGNLRKKEWKQVLKFSKYSILSDRLPQGGYILMNGISGALDLISSEIGDLLKDAMWSEHPELAQPVISQLSTQTVADFKEGGHLTELDEEEERSLVVTMAEAMHYRESSNPRFLIVPNMDCNYRCTYCFERPLQNTMKSDHAEITHRKGNVVMGRDQVDTIFASIEKLQKDAGHERGGQIVLYGGEPLDRANAPVVYAIVKTGMERGYYFAAITNGHDLDHYIDLLGRKRIEQVQISIDGPKEVHDKRRIYLGKESSFDKIVANIDLALRETDAQIQIRVHVDPGNINLFKNVINFFDSKEWLNRQQVVVYANTVYGKTKDGKVSVGIDNSRIVHEISDFIRPFSNVYSSAPAVHAAMALRPAFEEGARFALKGTYCSANHGNYIFAADGHMYACWESVGKACSRIGSYDAVRGPVIDPAAAEKWFKRSIATIPGCQKCAYALVCGGGCAQYAEYDHGNPYRPYCDDFQKVFRTALADHSEYYLKQIRDMGDISEEASTGTSTLSTNSPEQETIR